MDLRMRGNPVDLHDLAGHHDRRVGVKAIHRIVMRKGDACRSDGEDGAAKGRAKRAVHVCLQVCGLPLIADRGRPTAALTVLSNM